MLFRCRHPRSCLRSFHHVLDFCDTRRLLPPTTTLAFVNHFLPSFPPRASDDDFHLDTRTLLCSDYSAARKLLAMVRGTTLATKQGGEDVLAVHPLRLHVHVHVWASARNTRDELRTQLSRMSGMHLTGTAKS